MAISGAATALAGVGTRVEIFGEQGTLVYNGSSVTVSVRGGEGEPNVDIPVPAEPVDDPSLGQAGLWRFAERCRGVTSPSARNSADGRVGLRVVQTLEGIYTSSELGGIYSVEAVEVSAEAE